jgi:hypothetical protein
MLIGPYDADDHGHQRRAFVSSAMTASQFMFIVMTKVQART